MVECDFKIQWRVYLHFRQILLNPVNRGSIV